MEIKRDGLTLFRARKKGRKKWHHLAIDEDWQWCDCKRYYYDGKDKCPHLPEVLKFIKNEKRK